MLKSKNIVILVSSQGIKQQNVNPCLKVKKKYISLPR